MSTTLHRIIEGNAPGSIFDLGKASPTVAYDVAQHRERENAREPGECRKMDSGTGRRQVSSSRNPARAATEPSASGAATEPSASGAEPARAATEPSASGAATEPCRQGHVADSKFQVGFRFFRADFLGQEAAIDCPQQRPIHGSNHVPDVRELAEPLVQEKGALGGSAYSASFPKCCASRQKEKGVRVQEKVNPLDKTKEMEFLHSFRKKFSLADQKADSDRLRAKYPDRVPIIVDRRNTQDPDIDKHKYLVPLDLTFGQFVSVVRKRMKLQPEQGLYFFCESDNTLVPMSALISSLFHEKATESNFLIFVYCIESTFGSWFGFKAR